MGACASFVKSTPKKDIYDVYPDLIMWKLQFEALQLDSDDLLRFDEVFREIDEDTSGTIEIIELLNFLDVDRNRFTMRVFSIFDEDGSNTIDFREFVISLWNYCTLSKPALVIFAFDMYDKDSSGAIDFHEMQEMLKDVYGQKKYTTNAQAVKTLHQIQGLGDGEFKIEEFRDFVETHPALLYPALGMQLKIQKKALGEKYWDTYSLKRVKLSNGGYVSIGRLMELHINRDKFQKVLDDDDPRHARPVQEGVLRHMHNTGLHSRRKEKSDQKLDTNSKNSLNKHKDNNNSTNVKEAKNLVRATNTLKKNTSKDELNEEHNISTKININNNLINKRHLNEDANDININDNNIGTTLNRGTSAMNLTMDSGGGSHDYHSNNNINHTLSKFPLQAQMSTSSMYDDREKEPANRSITRENSSINMNIHGNTNVNGNVNGKPSLSRMDSSHNAVLQVKKQKSRRTLKRGESENALASGSGSGWKGNGNGNGNNGHQLQPVSEDGTAVKPNSLL
eukprot:gene7935-16256_t